MELRQLKYFVKVAELHSFSEAARQLNITQSTISQQIHQLEEELGVELLIRNSRQVSVSDIGMAFLPQAKRTIYEAEICVERIHDVQHLNIGELRIGTTPTFTPLLKETILQFMKLYPHIKVDIFAQSVENLMNMLDKQEVDLVLSYKSNQVYPNIQSYILFDNRLAAIVNKNHLIAKRKKISLSELEGYALALPVKGMQARNAFDRITENRHFRFDTRLEINDVNMLLEVVKSTQLVTMLSEATSKRMSGIVAIPLDEKDTAMEGSFHVKKDVYRKNATKEFLRLLRETRPYGLAMMDLI